MAISRVSCIDNAITIKFVGGFNRTFHAEHQLFNSVPENTRFWRGLHRCSWNQYWQVICSCTNTIAQVNIHEMKNLYLTLISILCCRSYYSSEGIEYGIGRVPIGGTDFSTRPYTYDDFPGDVTLSNFSLANEDLVHKVRLSPQKRQQYKPFLPKRLLDKFIDKHCSLIQYEYLTSIMIMN